MIYQVLRAFQYFNYSVQSIWTPSCVYLHLTLPSPDWRSFQDSISRGFPPEACVLCTHVFSKCLVVGCDKPCKREGEEK